MKYKKLLIIGSILLVVVIVIVLTHNYFTVKQNWQKIHAIKFEQGTRLQLSTSGSGTNVKDHIQYYACESDCSPLPVSNVEIHPTSENTVNIIFSADGEDKNQISNIPANLISIDEKTGVLHIK